MRREEIRDFKKFENYDVHDIKDILCEQYELAYGDTYSIDDIRKALQEGCPVFARIEKEPEPDDHGHIHDDTQSTTAYFVGESATGLVITKADTGYEIPDNTLLKAWTGEAVIVLGKKGSTIRKAVSAEYQDTIMDNTEPDDFVLFNPELDSWDEEFQEIKRRSKKAISSVKYLAPCELPTHPVVMTFKRLTPLLEKQGIRASVNGAEIELYDASDPMSEFLHELGHVYWRTRLTDEDRGVFNGLQKKLDKSDLPAIFTARWDVKDGQELFCTVYLWYCKGKLIHSGYTKILADQYADGFIALSDIINRIKTESEEKENSASRNMETLKAWAENEINLLKWLNNLHDEPTALLIAGQGILKAKVPVKDLPRLAVPESICVKVYVDYDMGIKGCAYVVINQGILKGKIIVVDHDRYIDFDYMQAHKNYSELPLLLAKMNEPEFDPDFDCDISRRTVGTLPPQSLQKKSFVKRFLRLK